MKKVTEAIRSLHLPATFDLDLLVESVETHIQQDIEFIPCNMPNDTTGMIVTGDRIHILFDANVSPIHQLQIKLHELGHALLGHIGTAPGEEDAAIIASFFTSSESYSQLTTLTLPRRQYDSTCETEAELFATYLISKVSLEVYSRDDPLLTLCVS